MGCFSNPCRGTEKTEGKRGKRKAKEKERITKSKKKGKEKRRPTDTPTTASTVAVHRCGSPPPPDSLLADGRTGATEGGRRAILERRRWRYKRSPNGTGKPSHGDLRVLIAGTTGGIPSGR